MIILSIELYEHLCIIPKLQLQFMHVMVEMSLCRRRMDCSQACRLDYGDGEDGGAAMDLTSPLNQGRELQEV